MAVMDTLYYFPNLTKCLLMRRQSQITVGIAIFTANQLFLSFPTTLLSLNPGANISISIKAEAYKNLRQVKTLT